MMRPVPSMLRGLVPRAVRHRISAQLARVQSGRLERDLRSLAAGTRTIVAGPWLGEVGFELLYWVPFLRWFAETCRVDAERLLVVSRGGTAAWYRPFAARYREIFDYLSPEEFRLRHDERVAANGEQKQTRVLAFERQLLRTLAEDVHDRTMLHPSTMYSLFNPYWWGHVDESWVHRHTRYERLVAPPPAAGVVPPASYTAVKFYSNDCFPATDGNRTLVRKVMERLASRGPIVSLATGFKVDDHAGVDAQPREARALPAHVPAGENLALQTSIVGGAASFVGTYGGFSYLAPFLGVRAIAYYADADGFSRRHLSMAQSALRTIGAGDLLEVRDIRDS